MKKRLLLIALPALMVLSGCTSLRANAAVLPRDGFEGMLEDTAAHEDLFGEDEKLMPMRLGEPGETPEEGSGFVNNPKIGVQFSGEYEGDERSAGVLTGNKIPCYAVRFVAAVNVSQEDLDSSAVVATWTRGVSEADGDVAKPIATGNSYKSTVAYSSLKNGDATVNASSEGNDYTNYVVYTLYDIPVAQAGSYIAAYLTLTHGSDSAVKSKAVVARIDGGHCFSFSVDDNTNGYFLDVNHSNPALADTIYYGANADGNKASFLGKDFADGDVVGLFRFDESESEFKIFPSGSYMVSESSYYLNSTARISNYGAIYLAGTYDMYFNSAPQLYTAPKSVTTTLYFEPNSNWKSGNARFAAYVVNKTAGETNKAWFDLTETSVGSGVYGASIDVAIRDTIIFCRMNPGNLENRWNKDGEGEGKPLWNQTSDLGMPVDYGWLSTPRKYQQETGDKVDWNSYGGSWVAL